MIINKVKFVFLLLGGLLIFSGQASAATTDFFSDSAITVADVTFGATTASLLIMPNSSAESWTYNNGAFTVTNPDATNIFKVGSSDSSVAAIRALNSSHAVVACASNISPATSYISLPTSNDTYSVEPINLAHSLSYNVSCGAASCASGYAVSGSNENAVCVLQNSSGSGGGGGGSVSIPTVTAIGAAGITINLTVNTDQNGSLSQTLGDSSKVEISVPKATVVTATTFSASESSSDKSLAPVSATGASMIGQIFNIDAVDANKNAVHNFSNNLTITLTVPELLTDGNDLGVYFYDQSSNQWVLVPKAVFNFTDHQVVFSVNHLTKFAIFKVTNTPSTLETEAIAAPIVNISASDNIKTVVDVERKLVKKIDKILTKRLAGRILLQIENYGRAWYLDPISLKRYYLADGQSAYGALRKFGLGIKNKDIAKIPVGLESHSTMIDSDNDGLPDQLERALGTDPNKADTDGDGFSDGVEIKNSYNSLGNGKLTYSSSLINQLKGRIVIQTENHGEAWYINPVDGKRYYLANGEAAYQIMRYLSLGITNSNIYKIAVVD